MKHKKSIFNDNSFSFFQLYDDSENVKLNDMIEVIGFLSVDPALSGEFQSEKDPLLDPQTESDVETITHNPPPSLVPRLHAVYVKKLEHCNPLVRSFDQGIHFAVKNTQ